VSDEKKPNPFRTLAEPPKPVVPPPGHSEEDMIREELERGVLFSRLSVVPYGRMQFVDVTAGPLERSFRLATVKMHTAAAASDARIPGLEREEAARLRDRLAELGEAQAAGI